VDVEKEAELTIARIAAAIGEPARVRMLYCLLDGHARTATELAVVSAVSPSTASAHLSRLTREGLIKLFIQGKHRYYSLKGSNVARVLERLSVIAGRSSDKFVPNTPSELRNARTCYDHMAGTLGVLLHNSLKTMGWLSEHSNGTDRGYDTTPQGMKGLEALGIDVESIRTQRRRFAYACIDWSERQPHLGGALGAAILKIALKRKWVVQELDSRALNVTRRGTREMLTRFGLKIPGN
jgi:DNA-binding transcriptional ArsR family regulator